MPISHPTVTGPITGGAKGWPFAGLSVPLAEHGYEEHEYFIEGEATHYDLAAGRTYSRDGRWEAEATGTAPYRTRIVVYRPTDPTRFNGNVVVTWNNVSVGFELLTVFRSGALELMDSGAALVAVSAQRVGIEGLPGTNQGLLAWDPERYGTLSIPSDDLSFDIFTQAAAAVGPDRSEDPVDPMDGLEVQAVIAHGSSQSAGRLATYINAVHPLTPVFHGFYLGLYFANGYPLHVGDYVANVGATTLADVEATLGVHYLRELDVPVMVVNSEAEAPYYGKVRQPDTATYRYWETAGSAHSSLPVTQERLATIERDGVVAPPPESGVNGIHLGPVFAAALGHLQRWVRDGVVPPTRPLIDLAGDPPRVVRDALGIARGGIRLPQVEVPTAANSAVPVSEKDIWAFLRGSCRPLSAGQLIEMYGDRDGYLARFRQATDEAVAAGVLLDRDVAALLAEAERSWPGG
ncbi:MAG: alpha/beta hydrolase domain-containing protein [Dehalococcoidia bacterium]